MEQWKDYFIVGSSMVIIMLLVAYASNWYCRWVISREELTKRQAHVRDVFQELIVLGAEDAVHKKRITPFEREYMYNTLANKAGFKDLKTESEWLWWANLKDKPHTTLLFLNKIWRRTPENKTSKMQKLKKAK